MRDKTTRRALLAATGTGAALAGCMDRISDFTSGGTQTGTDQPTDQPEATGTGTPTDSGQGQVVDDFENMEQWGAIRGKATADKKTKFSGSQSVRIENNSGGAAGIYKAFPDGLDLTKHDLSLAVKLEKPAAGKVALELLAPGRSDSVVSKRYVVKQLDDWFHIDFGYTGKRGNPDLSSVQEARIVVNTQNEPIRYWVDDLRKEKKAGKGKVMFTFDDSHATQYDAAFQEMKKRKWPGVAFVIPDTINSTDNLTIGELREMRDAGWDISSHPQNAQPLTAYSKSKQRRMIKDAKQYLIQKGFSDGARFFAAPYNAMNGATVELVKEFHEYGFTFGGCPTAASPAGQATISRVLGRDLEGAKKLINLAAEFNQITVLNYHAIGQQHNVTKQDFVHILDHVKKSNVDVISASDMLQLSK